MGILDDLSAAFPEGREPPDSFVKFAEYDDSLDHNVICDFELAPTGQDDIKFGSSEEAAKGFAVFGSDGTHSLYAFWPYDSRLLAQAPIVFFDSEWEATTLLANTFDEFLSLLALGQVQIGRVDDWDVSNQCDETPAFQEWLRSTLGIEPAADPKAVVAAARAAHPDVKDWISERMV
jgi:hypothetical protein